MNRVIDFLLRRALLLVPVLFLISVISFALIHLTPGDIAENAMMGPDGPADPAAVAEYRVKMGLDKPIYIQYLVWMDKVLHGDLGFSFKTTDYVSGALFRCFMATLKLACVSMAISLAVALPLGVAAALWKGSFIDHIARILSLSGVAMPNFWLGYLLMILFGVTLKLLPTSGYGDGGDLQHMVLPAITLAAGHSAYLMRLMRSGMIEALGQDYVCAARAKGLRERAVVFRHALRNALIPVLTIAGLNLGFLLNGSVIVETVFAWPGIGNLLVSSIYTKDFPMVQGCILVIAMIYVTVNLIVDISYMLVDPRIRYGAEI